MELPNLQQLLPRSMSIQIDGLNATSLNDYISLVVNNYQHLVHSSSLPFGMDSIPVTSLPLVWNSLIWKRNVMLSCYGVE
jgi:hypothetical protein